MMYKNKGFTLIETILVMVVMAFVMTGALYLAGTVVFMTEKNQNRISATLLSQECAELIRNVRDTAWKRNLPWNCAWDNFSDGEIFTIESQKDAELCQHNVFHTALEGGVNGDLYLGSQGYTHKSTGNVPTLFHRTITRVSGDDKRVDFRCKTSWENRSGGAESIEIKTTLTHWK